MVQKYSHQVIRGRALSAAGDAPGLEVPEPAVRRGAASPSRPVQVREDDAGGDERSAPGAQLDPGLVRTVEEPVLQEEDGSVGQQRVPLHLPEADASPAAAALDWLPGDLVDRPHAPDLELVAHHVAEALVVDDAHEDLSAHLDTVCEEEDLGGEKFPNFPTNSDPLIDTTLYSTFCALQRIFNIFAMY